MLATWFLYGCASAQYGFNYTPKIKQISNPPVGSVKIAYIGDELLSQSSLVEHEAIYLNKQKRLGILEGYKLNPGYYIKKGGDEKSGYYVPSTYGEGGSVIVSPLTPDPFRVIQAFYYPQKLCFVSTSNYRACEKADFEVTTQTALGKNSFQQTLIYSGKVGNKINFSYREFTSNAARPAYNNNVEYDLEHSTTLRYKGAKLEVFKATNELIEYKVLSNFNTNIQ